MHWRRGRIQTGRLDREELPAMKFVKYIGKLNSSPNTYKNIEVISMLRGVKSKAKGNC